MLKTSMLAAAAVLAFAAMPALAQQKTHPAQSSSSMQSGSMKSGSMKSGSAQARAAAQAGAPAAANVVAPAVAVVIDPQTKEAVVVPLGRQSDVPPEATAVLADLYATGKARQGQVTQIIIQHGGKVTEVISNTPIPNPAP